MSTNNICFRGEIIKFYVDTHSYAKIRVYYYDVKIGILLFYDFLAIYFLFIYLFIFFFLFFFFKFIDRRANRAGLLI